MGLLDLVGFLRGVVVFKHVKTRDLGLKKPTLTKTQPNQVSIKLGIPLLL